MNPTYTLLPSHRLICLHYRGSTTFERWAATMESALADCGSDAGLDVLIDRRGITQVPSTTTIHRSVDFFDRHADRLRRVASVVDDDAVYGMCRMLEVFSERTRVQFRVFRQYGDARSWLGLPPDEAVA